MGEMIDEMMRHAVVLKSCSCGKFLQVYMTGMLQNNDLRNTVDTMDSTNQKRIWGGCNWSFLSFNHYCAWKAKHQS